MAGTRGIDAPFGKLLLHHIAVIAPVSCLAAALRLGRVRRITFREGFMLPGSQSKILMSFCRN